MNLDGETLTSITRSRVVAKFRVLYTLETCRYRSAGDATIEVTVHYARSPQITGTVLERRHRTKAAFPRRSPTQRFALMDSHAKGVDKLKSETSVEVDFA